MQAATGNVAVGTHVWVEDPELAWLEGEVFEINDKKVKVRTFKGQEVHSPGLHSCMQLVIIHLCGLANFPLFVFRLLSVDF